MSVAELQAELSSKLSGAVRANEPMARHTTFRIGGPAELFVEADTIGDLTTTIATARAYDVPLTVVGKGSNLLVADSGYNGVVVVLGRGFKRHVVDETRIETGAAVILAHIVQDAYSLGLSGLEFGVGVPGTVGGAVVMNAGSRDEWIGSCVESVTVYDPDAGLVKLRATDIAWGYRSTDIARRGVVVECVLDLSPGDKTRIRRTMDVRLRQRKEGQPLSYPSAGSVFRNPENLSAGRLIEEAGLKGTSIGGAEISTMHANFIVNRGGARASDVMQLIRLAMDAVKERDGIELKPEIRFLGSFDAS